jgi:hypothetical protein
VVLNERLERVRAAGSGLADDFVHSGVHALNSAISGIDTARGQDVHSRYDPPMSRRSNLHARLGDAIAIFIGILGGALVAAVMRWRPP